MKRPKRKGRGRKKKTSVEIASGKKEKKEKNGFASFREPPRPFPPCFFVLRHTGKLPTCAFDGFGNLAENAGPFVRWSHSTRKEKASFSFAANDESATREAPSHVRSFVGVCFSVFSQPVFAFRAASEERSERELESARNRKKRKESGEREEISFLFLARLRPEE